MGEPLGCRRVVVRLLQFLPCSQIAARDSCDGSEDHGSRLDDSGTTLLIVLKGGLPRGWQMLQDAFNYGLGF